MTITIKDLPQSAEYVLLKEEVGRKERIKKYIDATIDKFPSAKNEIEKFWKDYQGEYDKLADTSPESDFKKFFGKYDGEQDLIDIIKPEVIKQIDELLTVKPEDSETVKELKSIYNIKGHKAEIPSFLNDSTGGTSYLIFLIDLIKEYYLEKAPAYIDRKLKESEVQLSELDKDKWTDLKGELFIHVYSSFHEDKEESDLDETVKGINNAIDEIKKLIIATKENKTEDIPTLKERISKLEASLGDERIANKILLKSIGDMIAFRANEQREYEIIDNPDTSFHKITEILTNLKKEWGEHLDNTKESYLLKLALNTEEKTSRASEILDKVKSTADNIESYKELEQFWNNGKSEYDDTNDYDGKLYQFRELLKSAEPKK